MPTLGMTKRKFVFSCSGILAETKAHEFAAGFIKAAGMNPARKGRIDKYPYKGGGGEGWSGWFPLMESFLVVDVYTDLNEVELTLSTCKPERINLEALKNFLRCRIGPVKEVGTI